MRLNSINSKDWICLNTFVEKNTDFHRHSENSQAQSFFPLTTGGIEINHHTTNIALAAKGFMLP